MGRSDAGAFAFRWPSGALARVTHVIARGSQAQTLEYEVTVCRVAHGDLQLDVRFEFLDPKDPTLRLMVSRNGELGAIFGAEELFPALKTHAPEALPESQPAWETKLEWLWRILVLDNIGLSQRAGAEAPSVAEEMTGQGIFARSSSLRVATLGDDGRDSDLEGSHRFEIPSERAHGFLQLLGEPHTLSPDAQLSFDVDFKLTTSPQTLQPRALRITQQLNVLQGSDNLLNEVDLSTLRIAWRNDAADCPDSN